MEFIFIAIRERDMRDWLLPISALTRNQTRDLPVHGAMLQPIEPHQPRLEDIFEKHNENTYIYIYVRYS